MYAPGAALRPPPPQSRSLRFLSLCIAHEAIKSLGWPGMTMNFSVVKASLLEGLKAGAAVAFELSKGDKKGQWQIIRITPQ